MRFGHAEIRGHAIRLISERAENHIDQGERHRVVAGFRRLGAAMEAMQLSYAGRPALELCGTGATYGSGCSARWRLDPNM